MCIFRRAYLDATVRTCDNDRMGILLKNKIFTTRRVPFGLDLSDLSVKVMQLGMSGKRQYVRSFGGASIPSGSVVDGDILKPDAVRQAIGTALENAAPRKLNTKEVFCSLPEGKVFLRVVDMPAMEPREAAEAIQWEIEENIPLSADQVYYDWKILKRNFTGDPKKMSVLLIAVARQTVDTFIDVVESAGLEVVGMGIESFAQVQSLLAEDVENTDTALLMDIGDRRTTVLFAIGGTICFTSSIAVSSQFFNEAIIKGMQVGAEESEQIKRAQGIGSFVKEDVLFRAVSPVLEELVEQVRTSIDFFLTGLKYTQKVDSVVLCGGGANTKGLTAYLSKQLNLPVRKGDPWANLDLGKNVPPINYEQSLQYSTAIGLAILGMQYTYEDI